MPRATRAAARAQEQAEEALTAASVALPPTPTRDRVPLGEISHNAHAVIEMVVQPEDDEKKPAAKGKKGKATKKGKKGAKAKKADTPIEILEDDDQSSNSDAADQARSSLLDDATSATPEHLALPDDTETSGSSAAVDLTVQQLSPETGASMKADHSPTEDAKPSSTGSDERPVVMDDTGAQSQCSNDGLVPASSAMSKTITEHTNAHSPTKRISRIEDSVEALDALEDAIEKIDAAIPASGSELSSPNEGRKSAKSISTSNRVSKATSSPSRTTTKASGKKPPATGSLKASTTKPLAQSTRTAPKQSTSRISLANAKPPVNGRKVSESPAKSQFSTSKRVSSVHKTPFQPAKSAKPTTKSNFELPGEAVARRLKEQREQRQKRDEEASNKATAPKARTLQKRQAPEVKMTATARARLSLAQNGATGVGKPLSVSSGSPKAPAKLTKGQRGPKALGSGAQVLPKTRPSVSANTSAKRGSPSKSSTESRQLSASSQTRVASEGDLVNHKARGKEVFSRPKQLLKAKENEKKAKEEAAKKARLEAAERGRLASREWADKQKARKLAAQASKSMSETTLV